MYTSIEKETEKLVIGNSKEEETRSIEMEEDVVDNYPEELYPSDTLRWE